MPDPFITVADLTNKVGRDLSADLGAVMAVDAACDVCRTVSEQSFNRGTATVTMDGTGTDALLLPERPVNSAGTITVGGGTAITDYALDSERGILYRKAADPTYEGAATVMRWPAGRQNITLTYDYGYTAVPRDVRMVALALAERLVIQGPALQESVGQASIRYAGAQFELTSTEKMILDKYRSR